MTVIEERLREFSEPEYAEFEAKLCPTLPKEAFLGVRVPNLRKIASEVGKLPECGAFLQELPHGTYDENLLHSVLLSKWKKYDECVALVESFLPYVDNWAVCDTLRPKVFEKHKEELLPLVKKWAASTETYTCRFGVDMLMTYYLDDAFQPDFLEIPAAICSEEYYVNMMIAWYYATALAKQWDRTIGYLTQHRLSPWIHRKTIQKAVESFRITPEQKTFLKSLRD